MIFTLLYIIAAVSVTIHAALYKRNVRSAIGWIGLAWLTPFLGAALYPLLGINRIRRKGAALGLRSSLDSQDEPPAYTGFEEWEIPHSGFFGQNRLAEKITGQPLSPGNAITPLLNGDAAYPAMIRAIENAELSISLSTYIFDNDSSGRAFLEALCAAQQRGVQVRVIIDALGARYSKKRMTDVFRQRGVPIAAFLSSRKHFFRYANLRNHRKIMVVDGKYGFTGGMNIREGNVLARNTGHPIQDLHFMVEGPVVADLQRTFAIDWAFSTGEQLSGPHWYAIPERTGQVYARGIPDGPDTDMDNMQYIILGALNAAQYRVKIITPYFLPDEALLAAIKAASLRGVQVDIMLPEQNNIFFMNWAMTAQMEDLLEKGCRIHLTPPPFDHAKIFVVDSIWSLIGSTNWDPRSLRLNFEYNLECYDTDLAEKLETLADERMLNARPLTIQAVRDRPLQLRLRDGLARLFTPYL